MSNPALLDGSDAPGVPSIYTTLKGHLAEALNILDSLDQNSLATLKNDDEFRTSVQLLLFRLTPTPLSELVGQADRIIQSGLDGISAQISTLFLSAPPSATPTHLPKADLPLSLTASLLDDVGEAAEQAFASSQKTPLPTVQKPLSTTTRSRKFKKSLQEVLKQNKGAMSTVWIHLIVGKWDVSLSSNKVVDSLNKELDRYKRKRSPLKWHPGPPRSPAPDLAEEVAVGAWITNNEDAIVIAYYFTEREQAMTEDFKKILLDLSDQWVNGPHALYLRAGGSTKYGFRLKARDGQSLPAVTPQNGSLDVAYERIRERFERRHADKIPKRGKSLTFRPLSTSSQRCWYFLCDGPLSFLDYLADGSPETMCIPFWTFGAGAHDIHHEVKEVDVLIDGFRLADTFDLV